MALRKPVSAWPSLTVEPQGIYFYIDGRDAKFRPAGVPLSYGVLNAIGPDGDEAVSLSDKPPTPLTGFLSKRVVLDRSPKAGWRTLTARLSSNLSKRFPARKAELTFYLPSAQPAEDDENTRKEWVGKKVWVLGSAGMEKEDTVVWDPRLPATILSIERSGLPVSNACGNPDWDFADGWDGGSFLCANPLIVTLQPPAGAKSVYVPTPSANFGNLTTVKAHPGPVTLCLADDWQLHRWLTSTSPAAVLNRQPARIRESFVRRELATGMPRELVAYLVGDPEPAKKADLVWNEPNWSWTGGVFTYTINFDRKGLVTGFGTYGSLP